MFAVCKLLDHNSRSVHIMFINTVCCIYCSTTPAHNFCLPYLCSYLLYLTAYQAVPSYLRMHMPSFQPRPRAYLSYAYACLFVMKMCLSCNPLPWTAVRQCTRIEKNLGTLQWIFIEIYILNFLYNSVQQNIYGVHFFVMCKQICSCLSFP